MKLFRPPKRFLPTPPSRDLSRHKFDYPIVRHHPLFAKQRRDGARSNFSSLLLGENVRIIRRRVGNGLEDRNTDDGGINSHHGGIIIGKLLKVTFQQSYYKNICTVNVGFEIFNPEIDDMDSDDDEDDDKSSSDSSQVKCL